MKRIESVKENVNFRRAYHKGRSFVTPLFTVYWRKNGMDKRRLGITVSKKVGNSPTRNRLRRIVRAAVYENQDILPAGCDMIFVMRSRSVGAKSTDISDILVKRFGDN